MKPFEYGDEEIGTRELGFAVSSTIIGTGALSMPRVMATHGLFADGWILLLIGGLTSACFAWFIMKVAILFPKQNFVQYASVYVTKPIAYILSMILILTFTGITAYEARTISIISQTYLFSDTPVQLLSFFYLLVVVYGVCGSRVGLLRLSVLFLPIVFIAIILLSLLNFNLMEFENVSPFFQTKLSKYIGGVRETAFTFIGFEVGFFYAAILKATKKAPLAAVKGVMVTVLSYILIYVTCISVFTYLTTSTLTYPTIELGKEIEIGGGFLERFDAIFFITWIITVFNTTALYYDVAIFLFCAMFPAIKKHTFIFISAPIIYIMNTIPGNLDVISKYGTYLAWIDMSVMFVIPLLIFIFYKIKGGENKNEPSS
ncbi:MULTISPECIES: endospore germination permease [unclassified Bacillus (in: firmicutes)]|uniref:GerAB/ArcD/ProY family transporter n=1 Tax=unclassified Bacillus (in: firmicutes) TaxID=185979 RepID=UPI0008EBC0A0|nr:MULTISPECIES: endospore germination permease [unclassified Bacillus (in: firmicutes)]SFJ89482.1 spore germination protein [Bacillus sp. 71mf]SFT07282.1 spore germination protein [Bacillus sp. 103mf]